MTNLSDKYKDSLPFESGPTLTTITSNYNANSGDTIFVNTASSAINVTLPSSPTAGSKIKVLDISANAQNNNITVLGNGYNISGASAYIINAPDSSVEVVYINSSKGWNVLNEYISLLPPGKATSISATDIGTSRGYNNGAATVSFVAPTSGDEVDLYTVTSTPGNYQASGTVSPIIVEGLQSNTSYTFTVTATNRAGSSVSNPSSSITATTVPQAPSLSSVSYGYRKLTALFSGQANGGKSITSFTMNAGLSNSTSGGSSPLTVSNLQAQSYAVSITATNDNGVSQPSNGINQSTFDATGGTITTSGSYRIHTFTSTGVFELLGNTTNCDYLVLAGGGGGGNSYGGGGGAGGLLTGTSTVNVSSNTITIGAGGGNTTTGNNSIAIGVTTNGGGYGGPSESNGGSGGSGGGAGGTGDVYRSPGSAITGQGYAGGSNYPEGGTGPSGGGGGAGGAGGGAGYRQGGGGGSGYTSTISGASVTYAGGGGGGTIRGSAGGGGSGGGGSGGVNGGGSAGGANTGGGGGGYGNSGGSGIVIIRYLT